MRCPVGELGERMTAEEFGLWLAWLENEPADAAVLWASLMAAIANGPMRKRDKSNFTAADFLSPERWQAPPEPSAPATRAQTAAALRAMFKRG